MFEINTDKSKRSKKLLLDGYTYMVRKPGAGESLGMQKAGRELTKFSKKTDTTEEEQERIESLTVKTLNTCLGLFDALGNKEAGEYLDQLDVETLMLVIGQIFESGDEPEAS